MRYLVILGDGMADTPVPELGGKTPLEAAVHPGMDALARDGLFGLVRTVPKGMPPGSDTANLAVFGYDPRRCYSGRSPLEAASLGVAMNDTDVAYRCNFVTLSDAPSLEESSMLDYSAGEISSEEAGVLVNALNEALSDEHARLYAGFSYRQCFILSSGETGAILTQPHDIPNQPVRGRLPEGVNGPLLRRWMESARHILAAHPINLARIDRGQRPANAIWFWGEGRKPRLQSFQRMTGLFGAVISAVDLVQGIGVCAGMKIIRVPGATGTYRTDFSGKAQAAMDAFAGGMDYVYVHMEAPDECGHQHQVKEKVYAIEQIDRLVLLPLISWLNEQEEPYTVLLMPDHPTPLAIRTHTADPVPFALYRSGDHAGRSCRYTECDARQSGVLIEQGHTMLTRMLNRDMERY